MPPISFPERSSRRVSHVPVEAPTSRKVAPKESAPAQLPAVAGWKQELLEAPAPTEAKSDDAAPRSRPTVRPRYGCAFDKARLPPTVANAPTLASANVPRRGVSSTPFEGTAVLAKGASPAGSGSPARAAAASSRAAARMRVIARCS